MSKTAYKKVRTGNDFEALSDSEKAAYMAEIESETPEGLLKKSRPLNARERAQWNATKKKMGRPKLGNGGTENVSISVEKGLLKQADVYAKRNGMKRSELFAVSVREKIGA